MILHKVKTIHPLTHWMEKFKLIGIFNRKMSTPLILFVFSFLLALKSQVWIYNLRKIRNFMLLHRKDQLYKALRWKKIKWITTKLIQTQIICKFYFNSNLLDSVNWEFMENKLYHQIVLYLRLSRFLLNLIKMTTQKAAWL